MIRKPLIVLVVLASTSCIFGGGKEKNSTDNNESNVTNNGTDMGADMSLPGDMTMPPDDMRMPPGDMSMPPDMTTRPDVPPPMETYLQLDADPVTCPQPTTVWFVPSSSDAHPPITENSFVTTGNPPRDWMSLGGPYLDASASVAYVTKQGNNIGIYAGVVRAAEGQSQFEEVVGDSHSFDSAAEVFGVTLTPNWINRTAQMPTAELLTLLVPTSLGVYQCTMTVDQNDAPELTCGDSPWNQTLRDLDIAQPARLDPAPIFEELGNGDYHYNYLNFDLMAAVSGGAEDGSETVGLLKASADGVVSDVQVTDVELTLPSGTFAERLVFGITGQSFGYPILLMLHNGPDGLAPVTLRTNVGNGSVYAPYDDLGDWSLSSRLAPSRASFTFVDGYDINQTPWLIGIRFPPTMDSDIGYAGITSDQQSVIFARPGKFAQGMVDFIEFPIEDAQSIVAFKNIPLDAASSGRAPLAIIHGSSKDKLAVMDWGFGIDAVYVSDLLAPGFSEAQRMAPNWWLDDAGTISMLASRTDPGDPTGAAQWVVAAVTIEDLSNLARACGP